MERFFRYVLTALICIVAFGQFVQVVTRYVLEVPVMGLEETMLYPTIWLYMLGAINASRENTQIRANVLEIFIKTERGHAILAVVGETLSLIVSLWLTWWAWDFTRYVMRVWKESPTPLHPHLLRRCGADRGALVLMTLFTAWHLSRHVRALVTGNYAVGDHHVTDYEKASFDEKGDGHG